MTKPSVNIVVGGPRKSTNYTYKTVILKNNISFEEQTREANCIYVIKWNFDLDGNIVTIPENCVLKFEGGCLRNGTVICSETAIDAVLVKTFDYNLDITGSLVCECLYPQWFGAIGDGVTDDSTAINHMLTCAVVTGTNVVFPNGTYLCNAEIDLEQIFGESLDHEKSTLNIKISGSSSKTVLKSDSGITLSIKGSNNSNLQGLAKFITLEQFTLEGNKDSECSAMYLYWCQHVDIHDVKIFNYRNYAITGEYFEDANLDSLDIISVGVTDPIDSEPHADFDSAIFWLKTASDTLGNPRANNAIKIVNSRFEGFGTAVYAESAADVMVVNCKFEKNYRTTSQIRPIHLKARNFNFLNCLFTEAPYSYDSGLMDNGMPYIKTLSQQYDYHFVHNNSFVDCIFQSGGSIRINWCESYDTNFITCNFGGIYGTYNGIEKHKPIILKDNCNIRGCNCVLYFQHLLDIEGNNNNVDVTIRRLTNGNAGPIVLLSSNELVGNNIVIKDVSAANVGETEFINYANNETNLVDLKKNAIKIVGREVSSSSTSYIDGRNILQNNGLPGKNICNFSFLSAIKYFYDGYRITLIPMQNTLHIVKGGAFYKEGVQLANDYVVGQPVSVVFYDGIGYIEDSTNNELTLNEKPTLDANASGFRIYNINTSKPSWYTGNRWIDADGYSAQRRSGTNEERPVGRIIEIVDEHPVVTQEGLVPLVDVGFRYFDETLGKPIYASAIDTIGNVSWVDALGNPVDTVYPKVIVGEGTPVTGNLAKFNGTNIEDAGVAPEVNNEE